MSLKSPLGKALGLGSAGEGTGHWWGQRLSAAALVPLSLWFVVALLNLPAMDFYSVNAWAASPLHALLLMFFVVALLYHSNLGTQVVAEDYIHNSATRVIVLALLRLAHIAAALAGLFAIILIATRPPL